MDNISLSLVLGGLNLLTFVLMGADKFQARRRGWRVAERTLLLTALAGGSAGALIGMYLFRHKTAKARFRFGLPLMMAVHLLLWLRFVGTGWRMPI